MSERFAVVVRKIVILLLSAVLLGVLPSTVYASLAGVFLKKFTNVFTAPLYLDFFEVREVIRMQVICLADLMDPLMGAMMSLSLENSQVNTDIAEVRTLIFGELASARLNARAEYVKSLARDYLASMGISPEHLFTPAKEQQPPVSNDESDVLKWIAEQGSSFSDEFEPVVEPVVPEHTPASDNGSSFDNGTGADNGTDNGGSEPVSFGRKIADHEQVYLDFAPHEVKHVYFYGCVSNENAITLMVEESSYYHYGAIEVMARFVGDHVPSESDYPTWDDYYVIADYLYEDTSLPRREWRAKQIRQCPQHYYESWTDWYGATHTEYSDLFYCMGLSLTRTLWLRLPEEQCGWWAVSLFNNLDEERNSVRVWFTSGH